MTNFILPEPSRLEVRNGRESRYYTHDQLVQALADFGDAIADRFRTPYSNYHITINHMVKELLA